jgi:hypothetical protein
MTNAAPVLKHRKQAAALADRTRFKFWLAGRRGGKTVGLRESALEMVPQLERNVGVAYVGPTNQIAKELMWNELEERIDQLKWRCKPRISEQRFNFSRGRYIQILGAEKIRRIRGKKLKRVLLDEVAFYTTPLNDVWRAVRPCLTDVGGDGIIATTPNGKGTDAYDFYLESLKKADWKFFHWKTLDNPYIDPEEIERARAELDPKSFIQEYEAGWESFEGLAYYCFDETLHLAPCAQFDYSRPIGMALDFNVNPTSLLLAQEINGHTFWRKEYSFKNSSTEATVRAFCEDFKARMSEITIEIHGDSSGNARKSTTGRSDYEYVRQMLATYGYRYDMKVPAANPAIIDRVAHANAYLKNVKGESKVTIDPSCSDLIRDLSSQSLDGRFPSDKNNLGHKADAFGYYIYWKHLMGSRKPQRSITL